MLAVTTVSAVTFHDYAEEIARSKYPEDTSDEKIAARIRSREPISAGTVRAWKSDPPAARYAIAFSRVYEVPLSEVLVNAYGESYNLTPEELKVPVSMDPDSLSNEQLIDVLRQRLGVSKPSGDRSRKMVDRQREVKRQRQSRDQSRNMSRNLRDS